MSRANFLNSIPTQAPREGLVWEWLIDWNWDDTSWNWNNGTPTNITWVSADRGYVKECWDFNGTSSYLDIGNYTISDEETFCFWINTTSTSVELISSDDQWTSERVNIYFNNGWGAWAIQVLYQDTSGSSWRLAWDTWDIEFNNWEWNFIAITVKLSTDTINVYKNWALQSFSYSAQTTPSAISVNNRYIWAEEARTRRYVDWEIWLLRIYDKILNQSEIYSLYLEGLR